MAKGWGPGTRERQYASRDTIPQHWGEKTHSRTQAQLRLHRSSPAAAELLLPTQGSGVHTSFTLDEFYIGGELPTRAPDPRTLFSLFCLGSRLPTQEIEKQPRLPTLGPRVGR